MFVAKLRPQNCQQPIMPNPTMDVIDHALVFNHSKSQKFAAMNCEGDPLMDQCSADESRMRGKS